MKKLFVSFLCLVFAQNAFGAVGDQVELKNKVDSADISLYQFRESFNVVTGDRIFHSNIMYKESQKVGGVIYGVKQERGKKVLWIHSILVNNNQRRRGIGSVVFRLLESQIRPSWTIAQSVVVDATCFWDSLNFRPLSYDPFADYYRNGCG